MSALLTVIALELALLCVLVGIGLSMLDRAERRRAEAEKAKRRLTDIEDAVRTGERR